MKRSRQLQPLSREHHAGLVVASRIERGLGLGADPTVIAAYALSIWEQWLEPHFAMEEALLPPLLERIPGDVTLLRRLLREHEEFTGPVARLRAGEDLARTLRGFAWALREHIRFEEREMLPALEFSLDEEGLARIDEALHGRHAQPDTGWPVKFWEKDETSSGAEAG